MPEAESLARLRGELRDELVERLLPFWRERALDAEGGGFVGQIAQSGEVVTGAAKGAVLNARILWTFAAALRGLGDPALRAPAERAYVYFRDHFLDASHGGVYWSVDAAGRPLERRKQIYAQAFAVYGLAEYHRATGAGEALDLAVRLFERIEAHAHDPVHGGYFEAFAPDWSALEDVRLSEKDLNAPKSMNTHLHLIEAYTTLYRAWPEPRLRARMVELLELFLDRIVDPRTHHLRLFFEADWRPCSGTVSYGHDVEASWLLAEAAEVVGDAGLEQRVRAAGVAMARVARREGQDTDGGLLNELHADGRLDADKHWWPQAEALVGFLYAFRETGERDFLDAALAVWEFTKAHLLDHRGGEWFGRVDRLGVPYPDEDKVGFWKCPYHNARACLEGIALTSGIGAARVG